MICQLVMEIMREVVQKLPGETTSVSIASVATLFYIRVNLPCSLSADRLFYGHQLGDPDCIDSLTKALTEAVERAHIVSGRFVEHDHTAVKTLGEFVYNHQTCRWVAPVTTTHQERQA